MDKTWFTRKAVDIDELKRRTGEEREKVPFVVEKVIEIDEKEFDKFAGDLLEDRDFIKDNIGLMYFDRDRVWHCILVKAKDKQEGILVESEGYEYARYSAIWREENV